MGDPTADVDAFEDEEAPETVEAMNDAADEEEPPPEDDDDAEESELEELDETQFQDFDPNALDIPSKPVAVDESNVALLGVHKRKRTEEEERERRKKRKEGRREKPKRSKKKANVDGEVDDDEFVGGEEIDGKRSRRSKVGSDGRTVKVRRARTPEDDETLTPDERKLQ
jgi:transcription factor SPN1